MALAKGDELLLGVIYNPIVGRDVFGGAGDGAFFQREENALLEDSGTAGKSVVHRVSES